MFKVRLFVDAYRGKACECSLSREQELPFAPVPGMKLSESLEGFENLHTIEEVTWVNRFAHFEVALESLEIGDNCSEDEFIEYMKKFGWKLL